MQIRSGCDSSVSEIDIVATDSKLKHYILCECKFRNSEMDVSDLVILKEKSSLVRQGASIDYMLFSKSGFTDRLTALAEKEKNVTLHSLSDLLALI